MKKFLYLFVFLSLTIPIYSQVPNAGFENWTNYGTYEVPDLWGNLNPSTASTGIFTVAKGVSAPASGVAFIKLTTKDVGGNNIKPGIIVSGQLDATTLKPISGFAYTGRPEIFKGKWQYMGYGADAATISAWLTKWNTTLQQRDTVATLTANTAGMLHSWGTFNLPFVYRNSSNPDTAVILISSSGKTPAKNSFIWIDDLGFDGTVTSMDQHEQSVIISMFPNPAASYVSITLNSPKNEQARIILSDNIGNKIMEVIEDLSIGQNQLSIDLGSGEIRSGIYFLQLKTSSGSIAKKIIIMK